MRFLGLIKPNTEIGDLKLIEVKCSCGCSRKAMMTKDAAKKTKFLSSLCKIQARDRKMTNKERVDQWRSQMNYFVKA